MYINNTKTEQGNTIPHVCMSCHYWESTVSCGHETGYTSAYIHATNMDIYQ